MANEIEKLNAIAIGDIEKFNGKTDSNIEKINSFEFTGGPSHVWTTVGDMNTATSGAGQGFGAVNTAVIVAGGYDGAFVDNTLHRNGTTWETEGDLSATRQQMGSCGTSSAGLTFGGWPGAGGNTNVTQEFGGTSWSTGEDTISVAKGANRGVGTQTAALQALGDVDAGTTTDAKQSEEYNGTSWSSEATPTHGAGYVNVFGEQSAAYFCNGYGYPGAMNGVQSYNGSSWSVESYTTRINQSQQAGSFGSSTAAVIFGGAGATTGTSYGANKEHADKFDGSAFSATSNVPASTVGYNDTHGAGSQAAGLGFGGGGGSPTDSVVTYT